MNMECNRWAIEHVGHLWNFERFAFGRMQKVSQKYTDQIGWSSQTSILVIICRIIYGGLRIVGSNKEILGLIQFATMIFLKTARYRSGNCQVKPYSDQTATPAAKEAKIQPVVKINPDFFQRQMV